MTVLGHDDCTRVCLAVARLGVTGHGHTGPATGRVTVAVTVTGHVTARSFLLTVRGHRKGVGGLAGFARIAWRQLLPPGIVATLS